MIEPIGTIFTGYKYRDVAVCFYVPAGSLAEDPAHGCFQTI